MKSHFFQINFLVQNKTELKEIEFFVKNYSGVVLQEQTIIIPLNYQDFIQK